MPTPTTRSVWGALSGFILFLLQNIAVWSGAIAPNAVPLFQIRNYDSSQYLGFLALAKDHVLFPNLHMAWRTEPAMWNPLFLIAGRLGWWLNSPPTLTLKILEAAMMTLAGVVLAWVLCAVLDTRAQRVAAIVVALLSVPITMLAFGTARFFLPALTTPFWLGTVELSYASADGFLRGGLSNGPTLSFGTSILLASLGLAYTRLKTGQKIYSRLLAVAVFLSALVHPFEVFVIVPCVFAGFLLFERQAWRELIPIALAATLGLAPQIYLLLTHRWLADLSQSFDTQMGFARLILSYGIGFLAVPYLLLTRALPRTKQDKFLVLWWTLTIVIAITPRAPFPPHLLDGFVLVTALTIVRLAASSSNLVKTYQAHKPACFAGLAFIASLASISYVQMYTQLARDGASLEPQYFLNTVASQDEMAVVADFRRVAHTEDLALAPDGLAMLLVRTPIHSFASHQHLSLDYYHQESQSLAFFAHKLPQTDAEEFLQSYGIHWVVIPQESPAMNYFANQTPKLKRGQLNVFELSANEMKPYDGHITVPLLSRVGLPRQ